MTAMLDALRDSATAPDDLTLAPTAAETALLERAEANMENGRATYDSVGARGGAETLLTLAVAQASIAQAHATARLADAMERLAGNYRRPS